MDPQVILTVLTFIGLVMDKVLTAIALKKDEFYEKNPSVVWAINKFGYYGGLAIHSLGFIPLLIAVWVTAGILGWWMIGAPAVIFGVQVWNMSRLIKKKETPEELAAAKIYWYFKANYDGGK